MWAALFLAFTASSADLPFRIEVVDAQTGRGVPLVELMTTNGMALVTDSAGLIAFDEPGLMGSEVFFHVRSHGYEYPKDEFGFAGVRLTPAHGGRATIRVNRINIAERLYRITGQGIYRDSVILGETPPVREPLLNAQVAGQDSVQTIIHRGTLYWFWGDTERPSYPLGNFRMSGAISKLPEQGGLEPSVGVDLSYFANDDGFSREMSPMEGLPGPVWADGLMSLPDESGEDRLVCHYVRVRALGDNYEQGLGLWNEEKQIFEKVKELPLDEPLVPQAHPIRVTEENGEEYFCFPSPYPLVRVRAEWDHVMNPAMYEAYTCLKEGAKFDVERPALDRDAEGTLVYAWKRNTAPVGPEQQRVLIERGHMGAEEGLLQLRDAATGKPVQLHSGSVAWNEFRQKWIMIAQEIWGTSMGGEVWYAEAEDLVGPWEKAVKIITHDDYWFYNVKHHPYFDQDGGRVIYFEGTYTKFLNEATPPTPRYDYNQIMYRLDLDDPRLEGVR